MDRLVQCMVQKMQIARGMALHDLPMAKYEALRFLKQEWRFDYPKARRIKAGGRTFFDA